MPLDDTQRKYETETASLPEVWKNFYRCRKCSGCWGLGIWPSENDAYRAYLRKRYGDPSHFWASPRGGECPKIETTCTQVRWSGA